ncbi:hypothetical protein HDU77_005151 [Chytriomyces hyalinus]|nr:hypothetical protein HDU77_005151 [Chytriomyces hyalinus]
MGTLITVSWNPLCEQMRWALDRHSSAYVEHDYPWPLHLMATLPHSDPVPHRQQTGVPVWINYKNEVYKRSVVDMFMFLYAHSFNSSLKLYKNPDALSIHEELNAYFAPAATTIYLHLLLTNRALTEKFILSHPRFATHAALQRTFWPIIRLLLHRYYDLSPANLQNSWERVQKVFDTMDMMLQKSGVNTVSPFILGSTFTAADLAFSSIAAFILFPNDEDDGDDIGDAAGVEFPSLSSLPDGVKEKVLRLRKTRAGKHVLRMYATERTNPGSDKIEYRSFPSRYSKENNPWWAENNGARLQHLIYSSLIQYAILWIVVYVSSTSWKGVAVFAAIHVAAAIAAYRGYILHTTTHQLIQQLIFAAFGNPVPTERDLVELAQAEKDLKCGNVESILKLN